MEGGGGGSWRDEVKGGEGEGGEFLRRFWRDWIS